MKPTFILTLILLALPLCAQSITPNLGLTEPVHGASNWDTPMNGNFNILDKTVGATVYASNFVGAGSNRWTDKLIAAYTSTQCVSGCTIILPDSIADDGSATTPSIPSNVTLRFTGSATFTECTMNVGGFTKIYMDGARLALNGSGCKGINHTTLDLFQANDKFILSGVRIACQSQTNSTGIFLGNGGAQTATYNVSVQDCITADVQMDGSQFSENYNMNLGNVVANPALIIHSLSGGGGNSNTFYGLKIWSSAVGVLIYADTNIGQGQNYFINPSFLGNTVAGLAIFGNAGFADVHWYGGAPELNATGAASIVVNGKTVKRAPIYANLGSVYLGDTFFADAAANPEIFAENNSVIYLTNPNGYGNSGGSLVQVDSTSATEIVGGISSLIGQIQNVIAYPSTLTNAVGTSGLRMTGAPVLTYLPNFPNGFTGNPQTPAVSSVGAGTTNSTAVDATYGLVTTATHAASPGNTGTNEINFGNLVASPVAATEDLFLSFLIKSSVNVGTYGTCSTTGYKVYGGGANFSDVEFCLLAGQWTRVVIYMPNQASNTNISLTGFPLGSEGATISYTGIEALAFNAQAPQSQYYIGIASSTGATNPNLGNCSAVGTAASPSVASCANASQGNFSCATNATGATCQVNTTRVTANSQIYVQEDETQGTKLGVTCNTGTTVIPTSRLLASKSTGSFTINLGTVTTNPACFSYNITN